MFARAVVWGFALVTLGVGWELLQVIVLKDKMTEHHARMEQLRDAHNARLSELDVSTRANASRLHDVGLRENAQVMVNAATIKWARSLEERVKTLEGPTERTTLPGVNIPATNLPTVPIDR